jgi:hypothetical protein
MDSTGATYAGHYRKGLREGHGVHMEQFGDEYRGEFKNGQYHGCGRYVRLSAVGFFTSKILGATREGFWSPCNKTQECPLELIYCRCDVCDMKVGLVPDNRFQQCAIDAEALGLQAQAAAMDLKRQILGQFENVTFPGPEENPDMFGIMPEEVIQEIPEPEQDEDFDKSDENQHTVIAEVSMMVTVMVIPNGIAFGVMILPRRFHIMVYLTALLAICLLVELMVGLDFAVRAFGDLFEGFKRAYFMDNIHGDYTEELTRRGYIFAAGDTKSEL